MVKKRRIVGKTLVTKRRRIVGKTPQVRVPAGRVTASVKGRLRTLIINLGRREDRWISLRSRLAQLASGGRRTTHLAVERFPATDGATDDIPESFVSRQWTTDRNAKYDGRPGYRPGVTLTMTAGERGCAMSHVRAWREVAGSIGTAHEHRPVLVLEDDAVMTSNFSRRLDKALKLFPHDAPHDADALYLGYIKGAPWRSKVTAGLYEAEYLWTTVGYILWPRGAKKLLDVMPVDEPVDNFMAWHMSTGNFRALAVSPPLIDQENEWDFGSDVPHSDDVVLSI